MTGEFDMMIGVSSGSILMERKEEEGALTMSLTQLILLSNGFLTHLACFHVRKGAISVSSKFSSMCLMMNTQVLLSLNTFLHMIGMRVRSNIFHRLIEEGLFNKRPPNKLKLKSNCKVAAILSS